MRQAVDTNVLLRMLIDDGSDQCRRARDLLDQSGEIVVGATVLLETEWVLRSRYNHSPREIEALFSGLVGLSNLSLQDDAALRNAIFAYRNGLDFADAVHLHLARGCDDFLTFDRDFVRQAIPAAGLPRVREP